MKILLSCLLTIPLVFISCSPESGCMDPEAINFSVNATVDDGSCSQQMGLTFSGTNEGDKFGRSVSLSFDGEVLAIGAWQHAEGAGQAQVFQWDGEAWEQLGSNLNGNENEAFGTSLSLSEDGELLAIGAPRQFASDVMKCHTSVYGFNASTWSQIGENIEGEIFGDAFGYTVSLSDDGSVVAVESPLNYFGSDTFLGNGAGAYQVFSWNGAGWSQRGNTIYGFETCNHQDGVSLSGDGLTVACSGANLVSNNGLTKIFVWDGLNWAQKGELIDVGGKVAISADGSIAAISYPAAGEVLSKVFEWNGGNWIQIGQDFVGNISSISDDGSTIALGLNAETKIYARSGSTWNQLLGLESYPGQGYTCLSGDGTVVAIGNPNSGLSGEVWVYRIQ